MTGVYRLADLNISITSLYPAVHDMCRDYRAEDGCHLDFAVSVTQDDIDFERIRAEEAGAWEGWISQSYPDDWLEKSAVHRQIAEMLPDYGAFLMHGSAVTVEGAGYIFTAKSGTGKSTHTRLWRELLGERAVMVNDDKPLVRVTDAGTLVYGSPWDGKHHLSCNTSVPLRGICILERGEENEIHEIGLDEMLPRLLLQGYRPTNPTGTKKLMEIYDRMALTVKFYRLQCNMDISAAELAYSAMSGKQIARIV